MTLRFGTDGVRGRALTELTVDYAASLGRAAAEVLGAGSWLIGRDTRESGPALAMAFMAGLREGGADPVDLGVVPTPALAWTSMRRQVPAAMITASHNPWHDNGIKLFAAGGTKLSDDVETSIERALDEGGPVLPVLGDPYHQRDSTGDDYVQAVSLLGSSLAGLHVVLDCANGAMTRPAPEAFARRGARVDVIHHSPDGRNINEGCGATHPADLCAAVVANGADLGLAFDGDGDRVIAVDERGNVIDGDRLIALAALHLRSHGRLAGDTVVVTVMSNLGFHKAMSAAGIRVETTQVGDRYVLESLDNGGYSLGGEQSGHIIYRDLATTGDGLLAGLQLADYLAGHGGSLAERAASVMDSFPQVLVNVAVSERHPDAAAQLAPEIAAAEAQLAGEGRVLVRPSGTEPLVRVMVEAGTSEVATDVAQSLAAVIRQRWS